MCRDAYRPTPKSMFSQKGSAMPATMCVAAAGVYDSVSRANPDH